MQFVIDGPDIPDKLLQAHEEGKTVFFCGAGISRAAGLPDFEQLVRDVYEEFGENIERAREAEKESFLAKSYDTTLHLLDYRLSGGRTAVRKAIMKALQPDLSLEGAKETHASLLQLARNRQGDIRLVTTNCDRIFESVIGECIHTHIAPTLPIPKKSRWDGLVYLHGLLPTNDDVSALNQLVFSSGDFGLAYLLDGWAARFVSELIRNYVVCFVGYQVNDVVLRYMMDALAADRVMGEDTPKAYAFVNYSPGEKDIVARSWEAKDIIPILYENPVGDMNHKLLHLTLKDWAEKYRDGINGKEQIVTQYAPVLPSASTLQENFVGRMLWALSDATGLPAKCFAEYCPAPPLEWLIEFIDSRYVCSDLCLFGITPHKSTDENLSFSFICRPSPHYLAPKMSMFGDDLGSRWDDVMVRIASWLMRYLNDYRLLLWLSSNGGKIHNALRAQIERELKKFSSLNEKGDLNTLNRIRKDSPDAVPEPIMDILWRLLLTERIRTTEYYLDRTSFKDCLKRDGLTNPLRCLLRKTLEPMITLKEPYHLNNERRIFRPSDWMIVLSADETSSFMHELSELKQWQESLPSLLIDFQQLLRDALDLFRELKVFDDRKDYSFRYLPSIDNHLQNLGSPDWVILVEMLRDSWMATWSFDKMFAKSVALNWFMQPYPIFKRLALFAACQEDSIANKQWVKWLLTDNAWWLWSIDLESEVIRLLKIKGGLLSGDLHQRLEKAILKGPPREAFSKDMEDVDWEHNRSRSVWLRLEALSGSGLILSEEAKTCSDILSRTFKQNTVADNNIGSIRWRHGFATLGHNDNQSYPVSSYSKEELVEWLKRPLIGHFPFYEDPWGDICRTRFSDALFALSSLANTDNWPSDRWSTAFQVWSEERLVQQSWHSLSKLLKSMPDLVLQEIAYSVTWWIEAVSKSTSKSMRYLIDLCIRILHLPLETNVGMTCNGKRVSNPIFNAINHPIGHVTEALLNLWYRSKPDDNDLVPKRFKAIFTMLCDTQVERYQHGRTILSSNLITLFRVDKGWTLQYLLPLFNWITNLEEARGAWGGFLISPRLYKPLFIAFKQDFLDTANHFNDLGELSGQFATLLTYVALDRVDEYSIPELQSAFNVLPMEGLYEVAHTLARTLEGAGSQKESYWRHRISTFWHDFWPKSETDRPQNTAEALARMSISAGEEFSSALNEVFYWLKPIDYPYIIIDQLAESGLCQRFPTDALRLLDRIISEQFRMPSNLNLCLETIIKASPELSQNSSYQRLLIIVRKMQRR